MAKDDRKEPRRPVDQQVKIILGAGAEVHCRLRDSSSTGAMLQVPYGQKLPRRFELEDNSGVRRSVELMWQDEKTVGVRYVEKTPPRQSGFGRRGS